VEASSNCLFSHAPSHFQAVASGVAEQQQQPHQQQLPACQQHRYSHKQAFSFCVRDLSFTLHFEELVCVAVGMRARCA
jgi:hypothetical protein